MIKTVVTVSVLALQIIQPGQMTQARVWIQNQGRDEAVPVALRESNLDAPLPVHIINAEPKYGSTNPVQIRYARQTWEYEIVAVPTGNDVAAVLNVRGAAGWETTGIAFATPGGTTLLLKRPR
jgi:hypothetical protein